MPESSAKEAPLLFADRTVRGRFEHRLGSGDAEFSLAKPVQGADRVRIPEYFQPDDLELRRGAEHPQLLVRKSEIVWYGHFADPRINPWINNDLLPRFNDEVTGTVQRFIGDDWAVVLLDHIYEEASLHRRQLPANQTLPIHQTLQRGDQIKALVMGIDHAELRIELDCIAALREQQARDAERNERDNERSSLIPQKGAPEAPKSDVDPPTDNPFLKAKILLVEHDGRLRKTMVEWIKVLGGQAENIDRPTQMDDRLKRTQFTHIILDFNIIKFDKLLSQARKSGAHLAIWSGQFEKAKARAKTEKVSFLSKPLNMVTLREWIKTGKVTSDTSDTLLGGAEDVWAGAYLDRAALRRDARTALDTLCKRHHLRSATWIREERDNVFSFRAMTLNLPDSIRESVERDLNRSTVAHVMSSQETSTGLLPNNDPLFGLFDHRTSKEIYFMAIPFSEPGGKPRCVIFFDESSFSESRRTALLEERDNIRRIIQLTNIIDHVSSSEAFATAGRIASGTLHEVRTGLLQIQALKSQVKAHLEANRLDEAFAKFDELSVALDGLAGLTEVELSLVQKHKRERLNFYRSVLNTVNRMHNMKNVTNDKGRNKLNAFLAFEGEDQGLFMSASPIVLEQPLINILDNAIYHISNELWSRIEVELKIVPEDAKTPIHIIVRDNGPGMTAEERKNIFEPRETSKGDKGYGLGLY